MPNQQLNTCWVFDAYYEFRDRPKITDACDVILSNCYPFWEGCSAEYSLLYMKDMYQRLSRQQMVSCITETGWPNEAVIQLNLPFM